MSTRSEQFRRDVEEFLDVSGIKSSEFGRQALGDPSFIVNLRRGRSPTLATVERVDAFIAKCGREALKSRGDRKNDVR